MKWESPILATIDMTQLTNKIVAEIEKQEDDAIMKQAVHILESTKISVDKDELIKALNYDRNQYEKGYSDGIRCGERKIGRCTNESRYFHCSECGYGVMDVFEGNYSRENEVFVFEKGGEWQFCPNCGAVME